MRRRSLLRMKPGRVSHCRSKHYHQQACPACPIQLHRQSRSKDSDHWIASWSHCRSQGSYKSSLGSHYRSRWPWPGHSCIYRSDDANNAKICTSWLTCRRSQPRWPAHHGGQCAQHERGTRQLGYFQGFRTRTATYPRCTKHLWWGRRFSCKCFFPKPWTIHRRPHTPGHYQRVPWT